MKKGQYQSKNSQQIHQNGSFFKHLFRQQLCNTERGEVIDFQVNCANYMSINSLLKIGRKAQKPLRTLLKEQEAKNEKYVSRENQNQTQNEEIVSIRLLQYQQKSNWTVAKVIVQSTDLHNNNYQIVRYLKVGKHEKLNNPHSLLKRINIKIKTQLQTNHFTPIKKSISILKTDFNSLKRQQKIQKIQIQYLSAKQIQNIVQCYFSSDLTIHKPIFLDEVRLQFNQYKDVVIYLLVEMYTQWIELPFHFTIKYTKNYTAKQLVADLKMKAQYNGLLLNNQYALAFIKDNKMSIIRDQDYLPDSGSENAIVLYYKQISTFHKVYSLGKNIEKIVDLSIHHFGRAFLNKEDVVFIKGSKSMQKCTIIKLQQMCQEKTVFVKFCRLKDDLQKWIQIGRNDISTTKLITDMIKITIQFQYQQKSIQMYPSNIISFGRGTSNYNTTLQNDTVRNIFDLYTQTRKFNQKNRNFNYDLRFIYLFDQLGRKMKITNMSHLKLFQRKFYFIRQSESKQHSILHINNIRAFNTSILKKKIFRHIGNLKDKEYVGYIYQDSQPKMIQSRLLDKMSRVQWIYYDDNQFGYLSHYIPHVFSYSENQAYQRQYDLQQKMAFTKKKHLSFLNSFTIDSVLFSELQKPSFMTRYVVIWVDDIPLNNKKIIQKIIEKGIRYNKSIEILQSISTKVAICWIEHFYPILKRLYPDYCLKIISDMSRNGNRTAGIQLILYLQKIKIPFEIIFFVSFQDGAKIALYNANKAYKFQVTSDEQTIIQWSLFKQQIENLITIIPSPQTWK